MLSIDINHPDSPDFITSKQNLTKITGANISVKLNDEFKKAVENDEDYLLRWPFDLDISLININSPNLSYNTLEPTVLTFGDLVDTNISGYVKKIRAKELWDSIIQCAWNTAEPGILFWSSIIDNDPASVYPAYRAVSTNPCGEIPLSPHDSCRLIASNLYSLVKNPFTANAQIDEKLAYKVFYEAQIIGDILVDLELEAVQKIIDITEGAEKQLWENIKEIGQNGRRTGVGILGYGDMCAALGIPYGDAKITDYIMKLKMTAELDATIDLAIINGSFPAYDKKLEFNRWYTNLKINFPHQYQRMQQYGRRNISFSTIAPTGTISILAGTSSGCEPVFSLYYIRRKKCNPGETPDFIDNNGVGFKNFNVVHPKLNDWYLEFKKTLPNPNENPLSNWTKEELDFIIKFSPWHSNCAADLSPELRVNTQAILQAYTTHSISSTVNVEETVTPEFIRTIYEHAWNSGLKGITVYRDNCRSGILVKEDKKPLPNSRPQEIECQVMQFKNEKKDWVAFIGIINDKPYEIFSGPKDLDVFPIPSSVDRGQIIKLKQEDGTSRYDFRYIDSYGYTNTLGGLSRVFDKEYWNYGRLISALLRNELPIENIIKIIDGLSFTNKGMNNWKVGIIRALKVFIVDGTKVHGEVCDTCGGSNVVYESGCKICKDCGTSKCG